MGFRVLGYLYHQPPLDKGKEPCKYLFHLIYPFNETWQLQGGVPPEIVEDLILSYFSTWGIEVHICGMTLL
ncbi:MAG: hypothetical protein QXK37_03250 [Candidatus Woesearchaeota archaeon]